MQSNHPGDDRPRNGTPLEGEYYPEHQAPRQHFPHGYSQQPGAGFHQSGYPGQEPFAYPLQTAPAKKKRKVWPYVVGGILLVVLIACGLSTVVLGAGAKAINDEVSATKSDVTLVPGSCREGTLGWEAKVKIVNSGTTKRSYWVQVNLMNGQTRLGEAHAIVNDLGPGQTVTEEATGTGDLVKGATCVIGDVN